MSFGDGERLERAAHRIPDGRPERARLELADVVARTRQQQHLSFLSKVACTARIGTW
jgi:hypothetical protein